MNHKTRLAKANKRHSRHRSVSASHEQKVVPAASQECKMVPVSNYKLDLNTFNELSEFLTFRELANASSVSRQWKILTQQTNMDNYFCFFRARYAAQKAQERLRSEPLEAYTKSEEFTLNKPIKFGLGTYLFLSLFQQYTKLPPMDFGMQFALIAGIALGVLFWQTENFEQSESLELTKRICLCNTGIEKFGLR